jgi:hypothetical protein
MPDKTKSTEGKIGRFGHSDITNLFGPLTFCAF